MTAHGILPHAAAAGDSALHVFVRKALAGIHLDVVLRADPGFTILFGPSGAGKTTLLDLIAGLAKPDEGRIAVAGEVLFDSTQRHDSAAWKRRIGYVLQDLALFPHLTALKNVEFGLREYDATLQRDRSSEILRQLRIEHLRDRRPAQISGGERQRVALARTLVTNPRVLLLDEPLAALDRPTKALILDDLRRWNETHHVPILYVTHSHEEVFALGDQVIVIQDGRIVAQGLPHEVMSAPRLESVAQLLGFENIFPVTVTSIREERGTLTCRLNRSELELETPLVRAQIGTALRVGIRAGDLLLATEPPRGLSARNIIPGVVKQISRRDTMISTTVDCSGINFEIHLTLAARDSLQLSPGKPVWVVLKTHSCHLLA
jgi:molybdate transport system ATP-binding protein